jgi:hypothetical protein
VLVYATLNNPRIEKYYFLGRDVVHSGIILVRLLSASSGLNNKPSKQPVIRRHDTERESRRQYISPQRR